MFDPMFNPVFDHIVPEGNIDVGMRRERLVHAPLRVRTGCEDSLGDQNIRPDQVEHPTDQEL